MRLAVVERQLVMRCLDITSLARLASTCKPLRGEALHKESGKSLCELESSGCWVTLQEDMFAPEAFTRFQPKMYGRYLWLRASPLFRAHARVNLWMCTDRMPGTPNLSGIAQLFAFLQATPPSHILECNISMGKERPNAFFTEERWLQLLAGPLLQLRCIQVHGSALVSLMAPKVQRRLFALPSLTRLKSFYLGPDSQLIPSAVGQAANLTAAEIHFTDAMLFRALSHAPGLKTLTLHVTPVTTVAQLRSGLPSSLTSLGLSRFQLDDATDLCNLFGGIPHLRCMKLSCMHVLPMLRGLQASGAAGGLQQLERVEFSSVLFVGPPPIQELEELLTGVFKALPQSATIDICLSVTLLSGVYDEERHLAFAALRTTDWVKRGLTVHPTDNEFNH